MTYSTECGTSSRGTNVGQSANVGLGFIGAPKEVPPGPMIHICEQARRTFSASSRDAVLTATRSPTSFRLYVAGQGAAGPCNILTPTKSKLMDDETRFSRLKRSRRVCSAFRALAKARGQGNIKSPSPIQPS